MFAVAEKASYYKPNGFRVTLIEEMPMPVDPVTALGAVATVLKIVDSITGQWDRVFRKRDQARPHRVTTEQVDKATIVVRDAGSAVTTITAADLEKLPAENLDLIKTFQVAMERKYEVWKKVYPSLGESVDPIVNAQVEQRLRDVAVQMCSNLDKIFQYLEQLGYRLEDHYSTARFICQSELGLTPGSPPS